MIAKITAFLQKIAGIILSILPNSPLKPYIDQISNVDFLPYLNWFVPIGTLVGIGTACLGAITVFYAYQLILRWAKVVGD